MSGTSSASPGNLEVFVTKAGAATDDLDRQISGASGLINAFYDAPCDAEFRPAGSSAAFSQAGKLVNDNRIDEKWIGGIRQAFLTADSTTLSDSSIGAMLAKAGVDTTAPAKLTADEPVYNGVTFYSGWSDDPVSTGMGHFLEEEADLAMPTVVRTLRWPRIYSSRFVAKQATGRGWYTWADVRLEADSDAMTLYSLDGQVVVFVRGVQGWQTEPSAGCDLSDVRGGYRLRWRWSSRHPGVVWTFSVDGKLLEINDPEGGVTSTAHDGNQLVALAHEGGRRLEVRWTAGLVSEVVASDGRRVRYFYDEDLLTAVERPNGPQEYCYDDSGRISEVFDGDGVRLVCNAYDEEGRVTAQTSPHGRVARYNWLPPSTLIVDDRQGGPATLYRHDHAGRLVAMHLADGSRAARRFDGDGNPVEVTEFDQSVTTRTYDSRGNCLLERTGVGAEQRWTYDAADRVVAYQDKSGGRFEYEYSREAVRPVAVRGPLGHVTRFELDDRGRILAVEDADGVRSVLHRNEEGSVVAVTDGAGGTRRYEYHRSGQLSAVILPTGETRRWEYDDTDRAVAVIEPGGARFTRTYSAAGRVVEESGEAGTTRYERGAHGDVVTTTDAVGDVTSFSYDINGRVDALTDSLGRTWRKLWDALGRVEGIEDPLGNRWSMAWEMPERLVGITDPIGNRTSWSYTSVLSGETVELKTAMGRRCQLHYDNAGRITGGTTAEGPSEFELSYDIAGRPVECQIDGERLWRMTYTAAGRLESLSKPDGSSWTWRYDDVGRPVETVSPDGVDRTVYDASGRRAIVCSADGSRTTYKWGPDGRVEAVNSDGRVTQYRYDADGQVVAATYPGGQQWSWGYDAAQRLDQVTDPAGRAVELSRNGFGEVTAATNPAGKRWAYGWDDAGRLVSVTDPLGRRTRMSWDAAGNLVSMNSADGEELLVVTDGDGATVDIRRRDLEGRESTVLAVSRDLAGRRMCLSGEGQRHAELLWDGHGRLVGVDTGQGLSTAVVAGGGEVTVTDPRGESTRFRPGGNRSTEVEHPVLGVVQVERDGGGRLLAIRSAGLTREWVRDVSGDVIEYREICGDTTKVTRLEREESGRVVGATGPSGVETYDYDASGQVVAARRGSDKWTWEYDACGRVVASSSPRGLWRATYDAADQLVSTESEVGEHSFGYDGSGRRISDRSADASVHYSWDPAGRLAAIERVTGDSTHRVEFGYDVLGRFVQVGDIDLEWDGSAAFGLLPSRMGDRRFLEVAGVVLAEQRDGKVSYLSADWRGSVGSRLVWGERVARQTSVTPAQPELGFLGEIEVFGLVWLRNRWYDPATHTFLSPDPQRGELMAIGHGLNSYVYAHNDPINFLDPTGLHPVTAADASSQMSSWKQGHWKEVLTTVAAVAATGVLLAVAPEAAPLLLPMAVGAVGGAGGTIIADKIQGKPIDWGQVVMDGALGMAAGAGGGALGAVAKAGEWAPALTRTAMVGYGATSNAGVTAADRWATGAPFSTTDELISAGTGGAAGLMPHTTWQDQTNLTPKQLAVAQSDNPAKNFYVPRVNAAKTAAEGVNNTRDNMANLATGSGTPSLLPPDPTPPVSPIVSHYAPVGMPPLPKVF